MTDIVERWKASGLQVFIDSDYAADMWGQDLVEYFQTVYAQRARFAVIFVSSEYATKMWTRHERRTVLMRGLEQVEPYILPIRLDDTDLPGLRSTVGYLDARRLGIDQIVDIGIAKVKGARPAAPLRIKRVPRQEFERQLVLLQRPPAWEYLYFAGVLLQEREAVEVRFRDWELGYTGLTGAHYEDDVAALAFTGLASKQALHIVQTFSRLWAQEAQTQAFGPPGTPGDSEKILHLAQRWNAAYTSLLGWAEQVRGAVVPDDFDDVVDALASLVTHPILSYRKFVDDFVGMVDETPARLERGEQVNLSITLKIEIPDSVVARFKDSLKKVAAKYG